VGFWIFGLAGAGGHMPFLAFGHGVVANTFPLLRINRPGDHYDLCCKLDFFKSIFGLWLHD
jgi:hypothetical protein